MKNEYDSWLEQAESDLSAAGNSLTSGNYDWALFQAQQAAEKALKSFFLKKTGEIIKAHDLTFFAKKLNLPEDLIALCRELNRVYTETRYPGISDTIPAKRFSSADAERSISHARRIIAWLKK